MRSCYYSVVTAVETADGAMRAASVHPLRTSSHCSPAVAVAAVVVAAAVP